MLLTLVGSWVEALEQVLNSSVSRMRANSSMEGMILDSAVDVAEVPLS